MFVNIGIVVSGVYQQIVEIIIVLEVGIVQPGIVMEFVKIRLVCPGVLIVLKREIHIVQVNGIVYPGMEMLVINGIVQNGVLQMFPTMLDVQVDGIVQNGMGTFAINGIV